MTRITHIDRATGDEEFHTVTLSDGEILQLWSGVPRRNTDHDDYEMLDEHCGPLQVGATLVETEGGIQQTIYRFVNGKDHRP